MNAILFVCMALFNVSVCSQSCSDYSITIKIRGIKNDRGLVRVSVYSSPEGFPRDRLKCFRLISVAPQNRTAEAVFTIPEGTYAIAVMHDENNNGKMDTNFFGVPTEGYCVSNNATGFMTAPSFNDARFELNKTTVLNLKMIN